MSVFKDRTGQRFGRLVVLKLTGDKTRHGKLLWVCKCDCGATKITTGASLVTKHAQSCGCLHRDNAAKMNFRHGLKKLYPIEYHTWRRMINRCERKIAKDYPRFGGRGIKVCKKWRHDFKAFFLDMGERPQNMTSLDRIDSNKNYTPTNCRWADIETQNNNKRNNLYLTYKGEKLSVSMWAKRLGISYNRTRKRVYRGWTTKRVLGFAP
jgi:hypothetical protein